MKRAKNKVYCVSCRREKLLFETQGEADRYIKFYREERVVLDKNDPAKSYYCPFCGGYHLTSDTSRNHSKWFDKRDNRMLRKVDDIIKSKEDIEPYIESVNSKMKNEVEQLIVKGELDDAEKAINACRKELRPFKRCDGTKYGQWLAEDRKIDLALARVAMIRQLGKATEEEQQEYRSKEPITAEEIANRTAFENYIVIRAARRKLYENEQTRMPGDT